MIRMQLLAVAAAGLAAAGCSYTSTTQAVAPPRPVALTPAYVPPTTVVYTDTPPVPTYVPPAPPQPPAGVQAFRDEYGFRYDGQGNRLDARGDIISPHSTTP